MVIARAADVGMKDRRALCGARMDGMPIELVVEDGANRSVSERADLDGAGGGGFQPRDTKWARQMEDAEAGAKALLGVGPLLENEIAERRGCRPDEGGVSTDAAYGPVSITAMTGWHVVGDGGVLAVAASALMRGNALTSGKNLHGPTGEADLDLGAGEAVGHAVEVLLDLDVIIDADPADAPLRKHVRLDRQGLECRPVEFFE
jgi:hypothetical protein